MHYWFLLLLLAIGSFSFIPTGPLDALCIPRKPIFPSYIRCIASSGTWRVDDQLRYPSPKILPSNGNAHVRTQGNLLWTITQMYFFVVVCFIGSCCFCSLFPGTFRGQFYCPVCPCWNAVSRHSVDHELELWRNTGASRFLPEIVAI